MLMFVIFLLNFTYKLNDIMEDKIGSQNYNKTNTKKESISP